MRKLVILVAWLLLIGALNGVVIDSFAQTPGRYTIQNKRWMNAVESLFYVGKRSAYVSLGYATATKYKDLFEDNLPIFVTMNPSPVNSTSLRSAIGFFIHLLQPFYALGILVASFYLMFVSASPGDRHRIKSMLTKLLTGMIVISLSPAILQLFFSLSEGLTWVIMGVTNVDVFLATMDDVLSTLLTFFGMVTFVDMSLGFYTMLPMMLLIWGLFSVLFLRYVIVTMFCIIFPLVIFLYSFEFTRPLGRNMLEQMILWTVIQQFNAVVIAAVAVCIATRPENFMIIRPFGFADIDILAITSCFALIITPLLVLRLFRNFLP